MMRYKSLFCVLKSKNLFISFRIRHIICKFAPNQYRIEMRIIQLALMVLLVSLSSLSQTLSAKDGDKFVLVIDPGHGGGDVGTPKRRGKLHEKEVALNVALYLGWLVEQNYKDVKVVYTRKTDIYPSLPERAKIAREAKGDLFISIHVNAADNKSARGFETYIFGVTGLKGKSASEQKRLRERVEVERENLDISGRPVDFEKDIDLETRILCQTQREKHNKYSEQVADDVHSSMIAAIRRTYYSKYLKDRGIKAKNIFVLCYVPMPAILVELGYMSNPQEEKFLNTRDGRRCLARSLFQGFEKYKRSWDKRQLVHVERETPAAQPEEVTPPPVETPVVVQPSRTDKTPEKKQQQSEQPKENKSCYKVQFLSDKKLHKKGAPALKGLWPVSYYKEGDIYRYTYGEAPTREALSPMLKQVRQKFSDAFPARFGADGKRIR